MKVSSVFAVSAKDVGGLFGCQVPIYVISTLQKLLNIAI